MYPLQNIIEILRKDKEFRTSQGMYLENVLQNADKEVLFYLKLILSNESAN
jgi:hypothetical protein